MKFTTAFAYSATIAYICTVLIFLTQNMKTMKDQLWKLCRILGMMALALTLNSSMCSEDDEEEKTPKFKSVWQYESFVCEAYTADGSDPYLTDEGEGGSNYPLGVTITRDKMQGGEEDELYAFGEDGFIYWGHAYDDMGKMEPYQWDGGKYIEGGNGMFYPRGQEAPWKFWATEITNEVLKHTDTKLQVKQTMIDGNTGTRLIWTNNFVKAELK